MKKLFTLLMCLVMVMTFMPTTAWAGEVGTAPRGGVTYQENTLYCISSWGATCENGIITVTDLDAVSESVTLELNWDQDLYFVKLNENGELQAVDVEVSMGTEEPGIELYIEQAMEDGVIIPYCYTVWANNIGSCTIKEAAENGSEIAVQAQLPVFGAYYNDTVSEDSIMFTDIGFSYLRDGGGFSENEVFYVALKKDAVESADDLELIISHAGEVITSGIIAGEMTTSADGQHYVWPVSVSDQFRSAENNNTVYISLYRGEDEMYWDCYNIYDSQTIPEENQLVWVAMNDGKSIDNEGYIASENGRFDYFEDILGVVGDTLEPICFGDYIEYEDATKAVYPVPGTFDNFTASEIENNPGYYRMTFTNPGKTVFQINDTEAGRSYLMFITVLEAINEVVIEDLTVPVKNSTPDTEVNVKFDGKSAPDGYKPTVEWFEKGGQPFAGNKFLGGVEYTVKITLPWPDNSGFPDAVVAGGFEISFDEEANLVLTKTFAETDPRTLSSLKVTSEPTKKEYTHGDLFEKDGMVVNAIYDDGTVDEDFRDYEVAYAAEGQRYLKCNDSKVVIKSGGVSANVTGLTVAKKQIIITGLTADSRDYNGTTNVDIKDGVLTGVVAGETVTATIPTKGTVADANAGTAKPVTITKPRLTGSDAANYTLADITGVTVDIRKATPTASDFNLPTLTKKTYTGKSISVSAPTTSKTGMGAVTVKYDGSEAAPVNVKDGGYKVTFDVAEGDNYKAATGLEIGFLNVGKATPAVSVTFTKITEKDKTLADAALKIVKASAEGNISWKDGEDTVVTQGKAYGWTFTPNDAANYNTVTGTVTPWAKIAAGGGGGGAAPAETTKPQEPTQSGTTTTADLSGSTSTSNGTTSATMDKTTADKIVDKAVENKSTEVVIDATANTTAAADSTTTAQVTIPTDTLEAIAEKTDADVTVKTDVAEIKLDNETAAAVAEQAQGDTVQIITEKVKENATEIHFELKVVCSEGKVISDFKGGSVSVTVNVPKALSNKKIVCVYIDANGHYHKVEGKLNPDGTYTFTTGHFSTYAVMAEEDADKAIAEQKAAVKKIKLKLSSKLAKTKSGKKGIQLTWKNTSDIKLDGVEIFRSLKKNSGYGKKPFATSKTGKYINTSVKNGKKYYYKVRGYVTIDGEKVYTAWSTKAYRTMK